MAEKRTTAESRDVEGRDQTSGAPGTVRGRAGTAGSEQRGARDRGGRGGRQRESGGGGAKGKRKSGLHKAEPARPPAAAEEGGLRELTDVEEYDIGVEGVSGEAEEASGTVPGSTGGTTGTSGHVGGIQTPGATAPPVRGIDPDEARGKVGRRRSRGGS